MNFNLAFDLIKKYFLQYLLLLLKPFLICSLGAILIFGLIFFKIKGYLLLIAFIPIILITYAIWQFFLVHYSLNYASYGLIKNEEKKLKDYYILAKQEANELLKYLGFVSLIILIPFVIILGILTYIMYGNLTIPRDTMSLILLSLLAISLITLLLIFPLAQFYTQSFFFKKENESFYNLFLNCYKYFDLKGVLIIFLGISLSGIIALFKNYILIYAILQLLLTMFIMALSVDWYNKKLKS